MRSDQTEISVSEEGINSRLQYRWFTELAQKTAALKTKKLARSCDKSSRSTLAVLGLNDVCLQSGVCIYPEFIAFTNHLYGVSRKLLNYLLFFELDANTGNFVIDDAVIQKFANYCQVFEEPLEEPGAAVLQGVKRLRQMNIIVATGEDSYMVNPLMAGTPNAMRRRKLIDVYCNCLQQQGLDTSADFYPRLLGL